MPTAPGFGSRVRSCDCLVQQREQLDWAHAAHVDPGCRPEGDQIPHALVDWARDHDRGLAVGLDPPGQPHGVAPEVINELAAAHQATDDRSGVNADLGDEVHAALGVETVYDAHDLESE